MSLANTLALLRPTLSSCVNLTKYGLMQCGRDSFSLNVNRKAPSLARRGG